MRKTAWDYDVYPQLDLSRHGGSQQVSPTSRAISMELRGNLLSLRFVSTLKLKCPQSGEIFDGGGADDVHIIHREESADGSQPEHPAYGVPGAVHVTSDSGSQVIRLRPGCTSNSLYGFRLRLSRAWYSRTSACSVLGRQLAVFAEKILSFH